MKENPGYNYAGIGEMSRLLQEKQVSPVELVAECLKRIERLNPALNAFITVTADHAIKDAERAEREINNGQWKGPLHGIPIGIKDMFDTAGIRTTAALSHSGIAFQKEMPTR